jgi:hypothetical protein
MQTISVENWEEFEARLQKIKRTVKAGPDGLLFRGQADASWSLSTTLERSSPERLDEEELADWQAGRNAVYQLAALTIGARLAVADA